MKSVKKNKKSVIEKIMDLLFYIVLLSAIVVFLVIIAILFFHESIIDTLEDNYDLENKCSIVCENDDFKVINEKCICADGKEYNLK